MRLPVSQQGLTALLPISSWIYETHLSCQLQSVKQTKAVKDSQALQVLY